MPTTSDSSRPGEAAPLVRRLLPVTGALVALAWLPGGVAPANTLRWALMSVLVPLVLLLLPRASVTRLMPGHWIVVALLAYAGLSVAWASSWTEAANGWWQLALLCGCILIGSLADERTLDVTWRTFSVALLPSLAFALLQAAHLPTGFVEQARENPSGLFMSSQLYGEIGALGFVLAPEGSLVQLGVLLGVILSDSRASMLAVALAGAVLYGRAIIAGGKPRWPSPGVIVGVLGIALGLSLGLAKTSGLLTADVSALGGGLSRASALRWPLWQDTLAALTPLGHGIGSFYVDMPRYLERYPISYIGRPEFAENEFLTYGFELGIAGVVLWAGIFGLALLGRKDLKSRLAVLALLVVSCLGFPLHMPATVFLGGLVLGACLRGAEPVGSRAGDAGAPGGGAPPA